MNTVNRQLIDHDSEDEPSAGFADYLDFVVDNLRLITGVTILFLLVGIVYIFLSTPLYESNVSIQIEDNTGVGSGLLGDVASVLGSKTQTTAEIEILRSRSVVGQAVDQLLLYVTIRPDYLPIAGRALSSRFPSAIEFIRSMGFSKYAVGDEKLTITDFDVPRALLGEEFVLEAGNAGDFKLSDKDGTIQRAGQVGVPLQIDTAHGPIKLLVSGLTARPNTQFSITRSSRLASIDAVQRTLSVSEAQKESGILDMHLDGPDPNAIDLVLNTIANAYVAQNVRRKAEEAERQLEYLDGQLPRLRTQLEAAEDKFNAFRDKFGIVDLGQEAKVILDQSATIQTNLIQLQQERAQLVQRFTAEHPTVKAVDTQIALVSAQLNDLIGRTKTLPDQQQQAVRLGRDVEVDTQLYTTVLNNAEQLRVVKAGKVGNVRIIDAADVPERPISPNKPAAMIISLCLGLMVGVLSAFVRRELFGGVEDPDVIESKLGLPVYAALPHSEGQNEMITRIAAREKGCFVLSLTYPNDIFVESLQSLRTALQFAAPEHKTTVYVITGATAGAGKSFISANLAAVLAVTGKRVLLVDADLRRGYLHQYFGLERTEGLSKVLAGTAQFANAVHHRVQPNLDFLGTGTLPPNPTELFARDTFKNFIDQVREEERYDAIILDCAPVLPVADATSIAKLADITLLVVRFAFNKLGEIDEAVKKLRYSGIEISGVVLNDMPLRKRSYGSRYRRYQYNYQYDTLIEPTERN